MKRIIHFILFIVSAYFLFQLYEKQLGAVSFFIMAIYFAVMAYYHIKKDDYIGKRRLK